MNSSLKTTAEDILLEYYLGKLSHTPLKGIGCQVLVTEDAIKPYQVLRVRIGQLSTWAACHPDVLFHAANRIWSDLYPLFFTKKGRVRKTLLK